MEFHPCGICGIHVLETDEAVQCDGQCSLWHHRECLGMTLAEYLKLSRGQEDWFCTKCIVKQEIKQEAQAHRRRQQKSDMGKTKIECKKLEALAGDQKCVFCHQTDIDEMKYGPVYMHKNIITHYYCLLLSSNMEQNGRDSDGILGFLGNDIHKEVRRGARLYCTYCRSGGATLGCAVAKCKVVFHLPCGMKHGTLHQFFGEFKSFCAKHRPVQKISAKILAESSKNAMCGICYEKVVPRPIHETLWAPCCQKSAFFHRDCVQKLATSAGYFFKCPLCNNTSTFQKEMKEFGVYIPEQDASWECVPNAYQDLLVRHDTCDSVACSCPRGRKFNNQGTRWELVLCKFCGSQGMHIGCGRLKWKSPEFICDICSGNMESEEEDARTQGNRHRLTGTARTAEIHPSVSADRERERTVKEEDSDDDSHESEKVTISNRRGRRRIVSPPVETKPVQTSTRKRSISPLVETKDTDTRTHKRPEKHANRVPSASAAQREDTSRDSDAVVIVDSDDDDVEFVEGPKGNSCLKTNDGSTIPIIKVQNSVDKRLNVEGDVNIPDEVVDITDREPPAKRQPSPIVEEVIYSLPSRSPKPSTSTFCPTPSTSFSTASLPEGAANLGPFVIVDPATFRPEDYPPGTVLYRSYTPMVPVPQSVPPPQPQVQPVPTQVPMQDPKPSTSHPVSQLGRSHGRSADAEHPNLRQHRGRGRLNLNAPADHFTQARSFKHHSSGRRGRRCDNDRLSPVVVLTRLKNRVSERGFVEFSIPRRDLGFGYAFSSLKRKMTPLPSRPAKKMKPSTASPPQKKMGRPKNKKLGRPPKGGVKTKRQRKKPTIINTEENQENSSPKKKVDIKKLISTAITNFFFSDGSEENKNKKTDHKEKEKESEHKQNSTPEKEKDNSSPDQNPKQSKKQKLTKWQGRKIDEYLKKPNSTYIMQPDLPLNTIVTDNNSVADSNLVADNNIVADDNSVTDNNLVADDTVTDNNLIVDDNSFTDDNSVTDSNSSYVTVRALIDEIIEGIMEYSPRLSSSDSAYSDQTVTPNETDLSVPSSNPTVADMTCEEMKTTANYNSSVDLSSITTENNSLSHPTDGSDSAICDSDANCKSLNGKGNVQCENEGVDAAQDKLSSSYQDKKLEEFGGSNKNFPSGKIENAISNSLENPHLSQEVIENSLGENDRQSTSCTPKIDYAIKSFKFPKIKIKMSRNGYLAKDTKKRCISCKGIQKLKSNESQSLQGESSESKVDLTNGSAKNSKRKRTLSDVSLPKAKKRKPEKVSPTSKLGTIQNYFTSLKKDDSHGSFNKSATTSESNRNNGKENDCWPPMVESGEVVSTISTQSFYTNNNTNKQTHSNPEKSPKKIPLMEQVSSTITSATTPLFIPLNQW
ncbi:uncharacterized protein LOC128991406 isoform X2 [Macrosteles quadrilineatus]|uniref:uncharacterized protein LOC128991406 isoform X2 n=1 Tax=Macrosteles quadrilineatus TaxID=74068 RepID=UPI0023E2CC38|nr:uncharacterized protein LOC128991406 isoform X2 [Macrosteles quadrilineatus]